jgi:hypothetical protein
MIRMGIAGSSEYNAHPDYNRKPKLAKCTKMIHANKKQGFDFISIKIYYICLFAADLAQKSLSNYE